MGTGLRLGQQPLGLADAPVADAVRDRAAERLAEAQVGQPPRDAEMASDVVHADPEAGTFVDERQGAPDQLERRADSDGRAARADARVSSTER